MSLSQTQGLSQTQRLKLEALLLPTPLCWLDPDPEKEKARASQIRDLFGLQEPNDDEKEQLTQAREDAAGALTGIKKPPPVRAPTPLIHPLGDDAGRPTDPKAMTKADAPATLAELEAVWEAWTDTLKSFSQPEQLLAEWPALVRAVREHPDFKWVPNDPALPDHSVVAHRVLTSALIGARDGGDDAALLLVQVGPVQPFIDASRRTRDLWAGSYLMSLMSAKVVEHLMGKLGPDAVITPQPESSALLQRIVYGDKNVSNEEALQPALPAKVMALVPSRQADDLGAGCLKVVEDLWEALWACCERQVQRRGGSPFIGWDAGAKEQRAAFLERSTTVQPWPRETDAVWRYLDTLRPTLDPSAKTPPKELRESLGVTYGALSGALWAIHSAQRDATVPPAHVGDHRFKCRVCGQLEALGPVDGHRRPVEPNGKPLTFWETISRSQHNNDQDKKPDDVSIEGFDLKPNEQLCAICLMKRLGVVGLVVGALSAKGAPRDADLEWEVRSFPSVPSLACAPFRHRMICALLENEDKARAVIGAWVTAIGLAIKALPYGAPQSVRSGLAEIQNLVDKAKGRPDAELVRSVATIDGPWFDEDAYEPERAWTEQVGQRPNPEDKAFKDFSTKLIEAGPLWRAVTDHFDDKPSHYVAALYLDGDQLSKWLNGSHKDTPTYGQLMDEHAPEALVDTPRAVSPALQGEISARLSALAGGLVKEVVDRHFGRLVYCGGDDVVALLPASHVLQCADALALLFQAPRHLGPKVTVSAGIHIQHQREPLGRLIKGARKAEKLSKKRRDDLTIKLTPRSGDGLTLTVPWVIQKRPPSDNTPPVTPKWYVEKATRAVGMLLALAGVTDETTGESPLNLKLGHVLRAELGSLGYRPGAIGGRTVKWSELETMIEGRVLALANATGAGSSKQAALRLPLALLHEDEGCPDRLVKTLLLARFLAREAPIPKQKSTEPSTDGKTP